MDNNANIDYVSIDEACEILNNRKGNKTTWNKSRLFELNLEMFAWVEYDENYARMFLGMQLREHVASLGRYSDNQQLMASKVRAAIPNTHSLFPKYTSHSVALDEIRFKKNDIIALSIQEADCNNISPPTPTLNPPYIIQTKKPLMIMQEEAIIEALNALSFELKNLYRAKSTGTKGERNRIKGQLKIPSELFRNEGVFNKAWSRVLDRAEDLRNK